MSSLLLQELHMNIRSESAVGLLRCSCDCLRRNAPIPSIFSQPQQPGWLADNAKPLNHLLLLPVSIDDELLVTGQTPLMASKPSLTGRDFETTATKEERGDVYEQT